MRFNFGYGSWAEPEQESWRMFYPWPPFIATYNNEPGLHIYLSSSDTKNINNALNAGATAVGAAIGGVLGAFAGVVTSLVAHFVENNDGSLDIRFSSHGIDFGNAPAADPNVWIDGAWSPVEAALNRAFGGGQVYPQIQQGLQDPILHAMDEAQVPSKPSEHYGELLQSLPMEIKS